MRGALSRDVLLTNCFSRLVYSAPQQCNRTPGRGWRVYQGKNLDFASHTFELNASFISFCFGHPAQEAVYATRIGTS